MRVVFAPHAYAPSIGGAQRYTQGLAEGLTDSQHDVHVLVADIVDPEAFYEPGHREVGTREESLNGVTIHRLPYATFRYRVMGALGREKALRSARERFRTGLGDALSRLNPSVVITLPHLFPNVEEVLAMTSRAAWKVVYAPMLHEHDPHWSVDRVSVAVRSVDGVIALTDHERERLVSSYGAVAARSAVVPPGVEVPEMEESGSRKAIVLFVGRRTPSKRIDVLVDAMQLVWQRHPQIQIVFAGSASAGDEDPAASIVHDPRVSVVDQPDEQTKAHLLGAARVVVSPSPTESFGITTLEAWAHGTPVVVADTPVNRAIVRDRIDGLLASNARGFGQALLRLFDAPELAEAMGEEGRRRVTEEFTWANSVARLEGFVDEL